MRKAKTKNRFFSPRSWYYSDIAVDKVEREYGGKYIGDFAIMAKQGWTTQPAMIFWQETPPNPSYSNYYAIIKNHIGQFLITDGSSVADIPIPGLENIQTGEIIYTSYKYDYQSCLIDDDITDRMFIDGGYEFYRYGGGPKTRLVTLVIRDGVLQVEDNPDSLYLKAKLSKSE